MRLSFTFISSSIAINCKSAEAAAFLFNIPVPCDNSDPRIEICFFTTGGAFINVGNGIEFKVDNFTAFSTRNRSRISLSGFDFFNRSNQLQRFNDTVSTEYNFDPPDDEPNGRIKASFDAKYTSGAGQATGNGRNVTLTNTPSTASPPDAVLAVANGGYCDGYKISSIFKCY